ncbi:MAG: bifunctional precorrin-2 dehydrogenase/sirohydrochlorin ferrochelatase [Bacteroidota bacterium]
MSTVKEGNVLFPVFLKLREIETLLVGGGNVGLEKLEALLKNDPHAKVTIVSKTFKPEVEALSQSSQHIKIIKRGFRSWDLKGKNLVILATDSRALHEKVKKKTAKKGILTNVADTPDLCDFYLGSTVKKGNLKVGISTNGQSPTFAKRFREVLEEILPDNTDDLLSNLKSIRDTLKGDFAYKVKKLNEYTSSLVSSRTDN